MKIKKIIKSNFIGELAINYLHCIQSYIKPKIISDENAVKKDYKKLTGKDIDLKNPKTFCEKINWYKLYGRDPLMQICADKVAVREYVKSKGYENILNELIAVYSNVGDIHLDKLPDRFILKASHGTHMNIIVNGKEKINWFQKNILMKSWLRQDIYWRGREWVYKDIPRRIIAEKFLEDESGDLKDYKFFCFHGKPYYMQYEVGRFKEKHYRNFYDMEKKQLNLTDNRNPSLELEFFPLDTAVFEKMKEIASVLSKPFQNVRVDFYYCNGNIIFGELTFFHSGGTTLFTPDEWNYDFSKEWIVRK